MKKTTYTASVYYLTDGEQQKFENLSAENAEAISAQAHAGLDLHWFMDNEGTMYEFLIPWEAVLSVVIKKNAEEVSAPTDAVCNEADFAFEVTLLSDLTTAKRNKNGQCIIRVYPYEYVEAITLNGEDVTDEWKTVWDSDPQSAANVEGGTFNSSYYYWEFPVDDCGHGGYVDVPVTYMYNGESTTVIAHVFADGLG